MNTENTYQLCADFYLSSDDVKEYGYSYYMSNFNHEAGYQCFDMDLQGRETMEVYLKQ